MSEISCDSTRDVTKTDNFVPYGLRCKLVCNIIEIVCGVVLLFLQIPLFVLRSELHLIGTGLWSGAALVINGTLGLLDYKRKSKCTCISSLLFSIFTICVVLVALVFMTFDFYYEYNYMICEIAKDKPLIQQQISFICSSKTHKPKVSVDTETLVFIIGFALIMMTLALILAFIQTILCCCNSKRKKTEGSCSCMCCCRRPEKLESKTKAYEEPQIVYIPVPESIYHNGALPQINRLSLDRQLSKVGSNSVPLSSVESVFEKPFASLPYDDTGIDNPAMEYEYHFEKRVRRTSSSSSTKSSKRISMHLPEHEEKFHEISKIQRKSDIIRQNSINRKKSQLQRRCSQSSETRSRKSSAGSWRSSTSSMHSDYSRRSVSRRPSSGEKWKNVYSLKPFDNSN